MTETLASINRNTAISNTRSRYFPNEEGSESFMAFGSKREFMLRLSRYSDVNWWTVTVNREKAFIFL
jgi:hypothetical protein